MTSWFFGNNFTVQEEVAQYIQSTERKKPTTKNTSSGKVITQNWREKEFPRKAKPKGVHQHQIGLMRNVKRTSLAEKKRP